MNWEERIQIDPIDNYPGITADDLQACLHYAGPMLKSKRVYLTPAAAHEPAGG